MLLRFEAEYGGQKFSEIDESVVLIDIVERPAEMDIQKDRYGDGAGQRVSSVTRTSLSVDLVYGINTQDPVKRTELQRKVAKWANAGFAPNMSSLLSVSTRPGMTLNAKAYNSPVQGSALKWTNELTLTFVAYELPYWVGEATRASVATSWSEGYQAYRGAAVINPVGDVVNIPATVTVMNNDPENDWLTKIRIVVDQTEITLNGIGIAIGRMMKIDYVQPHVLKIYDIFNSSVNLIKYRTPDSYDDLIAQTGKDNQILVEADAKVSVTVSVDGWWL